MTENNVGKNESLAISYLGIRKTIGLLGIALPFILLIGTIVFGNCSEVLDSISAYYHTVIQNVFVGILCAISLFFCCYQGYDLHDNISWKLAGIFALGVAFFPTEAVTSIEKLPNDSLREALFACQVPSLLDRPVIDVLHLVFAALFFITLIYISWFLFTKSNSTELSKQKIIQNRVYRLSASIMLICLVLIALYMSLLKGQYPLLDNVDPVFWLESIALFAFGFSWITKGKMLFS